METEFHISIAKLPYTPSKIKAIHLKHSAIGKRAVPAYHTVTMKISGRMRKLTLGNAFYTLENEADTKPSYGHEFWGQA